MTQRDWQKDMDLCKQLNEWYEHDWEAGQEEGSRIIRIYETVPDEPFNFVAECENDLTTTFIMESRTALPYWLQEAKERGEREFRMQKVLYNIAMESNDEQTRRQAKHILSVLYPDTPAPKEGIDWLNEESCARCGRNKPVEGYEWCSECRPDLEAKEGK
ncbi:hypothetical protein [Paenibacillus sp. FSL L8-0708]|uniref:hypothetical protein n=1 Tax=Paenibacillus sp. FSL L8-0708 TaxID=2975311 RepID=UPI0030FD0EB9